MNRQKYIKKLLYKCGILNTKEYNTPIITCKSLRKTDGMTLEDATLYYRSIVDGL